MFFFHFAQFFRLNCFRTHGVFPQKTFLHIKVTLGFIGEVFFVLKQALSLNEFANIHEKQKSLGLNLTRCRPMAICFGILEMEI